MAEGGQVGEEEKAPTIYHPRIDPIGHFPDHQFERRYRIDWQSAVEFCDLHERGVYYDSTGHQRWRLNCHTTRQYIGLILNGKRIDL